jgi:hypothetical protein
VGLGRALDGELEDELGLPADEETEGGRAGGGLRAGLAGVLGGVERAHGAVGEAEQADAGRVAPGVQPLLAGEPAVVLAALVGAPVPLGRRPAEVGPVQIGRRVPGAGVAADLGADQAVDGEEGQLGQVGDRAASAVGGRQVGQALRAVRLADPGQGQRLDGRAQGVADGRAEQRSAHPAAEVLLFGPPPDGPGCRTHPRPPHGPTVRQYVSTSVRPYGFDSPAL